MGEDLTIVEKGSVNRRIAANTGILVGAKAAGAVLGLASLIILTRNLSIADVGVVLFLHAYMLFFAEVATFQSWQAVIRFGTPHVENKDSHALGALLRFCIALDFVGAVAAFIMAAVGLIFLGQILPYLPSFQTGQGAENLDDIIRFGMAYCLLILVHQGGASTGIFRLFDKFKPLAVQILVMPVFRLVGVILAAFLGAGLYGFLLAWFVGSFIGYLALPLLALVELKSRGLMACVFNGWPRLKAGCKETWPFVWKANIDAFLATGTSHLPLLLVMPIFGPAFVGVYKVAEEIARLLSEAVLLLDRVIYPEYARLVARGQSAEIWRIIVKTGSVMLAGGLALCALVALAGPWVITGVFGSAYEDAVILAVLLVFAASLMGVTAPLYPVFYALGRPGRAILARGVGLVFYIVLIFVLSDIFGKTGPGWAAIAGNSLAVLLAIWLAKRALKGAADG